MSLRLGVGQRDVERLLREVQRPSSAICEAAEALLDRSSDPWLVNHCLRAFVFGTVLGRRDGRNPDSEQLYIACLLHDLGITEAYFSAPDECFALAGAEHAKAFLISEGARSELCEAVAEAICLHINVALPSSCGDEAHLLRAGTALDVIGQRAHHIPPDVMTRTLRAYPRLDMKREVRQVMARQAKQSPDCRIGVLCSSLQMLARVDAAPFPE